MQSCEIKSTYKDLKESLCWLFPWEQTLTPGLWLSSYNKPNRDRGAKVTSLVRCTQAARHPHMHEALYTHKVRCIVRSNTVLSKLCHKLLADVICSKCIKSTWWHRCFFLHSWHRRTHIPRISLKHVPPWSSNTRESSQYSSTKRWSYYMYFIAVLGWE